MLYRIQSEKTHDFALRETLKFVVPFVVLLTLVFGFLITQMQTKGDPFALFRGRGHWLILILLYVCGMTYYQRRNFAKSIVYWISNEKVAKSFDKEKMNIGNKFGMTRNERRFNAKSQQSIFRSEISKINFSTHGITIKSVDYNFFNGNGSIFIPKEIENYEQVKGQLETLKTELRT